MIEISLSIQFTSPKDQIQIVTPSRLFLKEATLLRFYYYFIILLFYYFIILLFYYFIILLFYYFIILLFYYFIILLFYYFIILLFYYFIIILLFPPIFSVFLSPFLFSSQTFPKSQHSPWFLCCFAPSQSLFIQRHHHFLY